MGYITPEGYVSTITSVPLNYISYWKYNYFLKDHLGNTRNVLSSYYLNNTSTALPTSSSPIDYYPFGMEVTQVYDPYSEEYSASYMAGAVTPYLYNGKEIDRMHGLNMLDYGARIYDPVLGRWNVIDNKAEKYCSVSPYIYCLNNPIVLIDPDGEDVYLVIWYTDNGEIGHAAIAFDNYKKNDEGKMVADGTVNYYDFWPGGDGAGKDNHNQNIDGNIFMKENVKLNDLLNKDIGSGENRAAEGVIQLTASQEKTTELNNYNKSLYEKQDKTDPKYNGDKNNCSNFAKQTVNNVPGYEKVNGIENINYGGNLLIDPVNFNAVTPNFLFRDTRKVVKSNPARGKVLKENTDSNNKDFLNGKTHGIIQDATPGK